jgi:adenosylhomocysteinase
MASPANAVPCEIRDPALADAGRRRIDNAFPSLPVLQAVRKVFIRSRPLQEVRIAACLPVTADTAQLLITLRDGGAHVALCAANPIATQDDIASALVRDFGLSVFAMQGEGAADQARRRMAVLASRPRILMDEGCLLLNSLLENDPQQLESISGATEETTNGVMRLKAAQKSGRLPLPVIALNDAMTKHFFAGRYGIGQSAVDGILRATNILMAGMNVVVAGYGWCGKGVAMRARGHGANVIVTEIDPVKALEAIMDGFRVMPMSEAVALCDVVITVTGNKHVLHREHFEKMRDGAIVCNPDSFHVEVDVEALSRLASTRRTVRETVEEFRLRDGRRVFVLEASRLWSAGGHMSSEAPASVTDMSCASHAMAVEYLVREHRTLEKRVYAVPAQIDREVARIKIEAMGYRIDRLNVEQEKYLAAWPEAN